ncbi:EAL domain-containing protein [Indiicoccus explosivorum]|uniref:EAL domain-containing protein n=1 Tax=Indiicoccus explosivorum TaxID=1917864 RepID=UPI00138FC7A8|nr:EAL domain-containing protein [Indiicoccus explosivorum]
MESLTQSESLFDIYKSLFDFNPDACYAIDLDGRFRLFNEAASRITGLSQEEAVGSPFSSLIPKDQLPGTVSFFQRVLQGERGQFDTAIRGKDGSRLTLSLTAVPVYADGEVCGVVGTARDVTEKNRITLLLNEQNRVLEMIANSHPLQEVLEQILQIVEQVSDQNICSIMLADEDHESLWMAGSRNLPEAYSSLIDGIAIGRNIGSCSTAAHDKRVVVASDIAKDSQWPVYREQALECGLRACWSAPILDSGGDVLGVFAIYHSRPHVPTETDMHVIEKTAHLASLAIRHYRAEEHIKFMAFYDPLTGLPNKRLFSQRVAEAVGRCRTKENDTLAVLYIDLDRFKLINDTLGHSAGDSLLQQVAKRVAGCIRKTDIASRHSGDEFTVLLEHTSKEAAGLVAKRILTELANPFDVEDNEIFITPSIGISMYPPDGETPEDLLRKADMAMYQVKKEGKNSFHFYDETLSSRTFDRLQIENELRKAIGADQFSLVFQPIVDLTTGKLAGAEALLRWEHPEMGNIPPDRFIPVAEETGLIIPIGEWVLQTACRELREWQKAGAETFTIAVNLSLRQFYQPDLTEMIGRILEEAGISPEKLTIEITESMTMNVKKATSILYRLKHSGVKISVDDFGTGYSSLSYLKEFPIDYLKIDRSFIRDIALSNGNKNIAATIITMAHNLGMKVIAEGVETSEQLSFLKQQNSDEAQGYLFSKPLTGLEFNMLLGNGQQEAN